MYHQFNIQQYYVLPTQCTYVFYVDLRKTAIISLYRINWLVFITGTLCVYCAVLTGCLSFRLILVTEVPLMAGIPCAVFAVLGRVCRRNRQMKIFY